jgi:glycerol kinase
MTYFLAIDQSTSATKALLFDEAGRLLDKESCEHQQHYPQAGWVEHDAEKIWQNVLTVLRTLLARHAEEHIVSLSITNQRETVVVFDRATGEPLHPAIVWQCRRSVALCETHAAAGHEALIQQRTGLRLDAYFSASKIQWLVRNRPDIKNKLESGQALIGTMDSYLMYRLTGGAVFATDHTNACRTLLFDIGRLRWDEDLCALFDVPMRALPEVRESVADFGAVTIDELPSLPIRGVMGDSQAALFAQRCFTAGAAKVTFGTGSSILLNVGSATPLLSGVVTTLAWVLNRTPTYALEGIIISSAATLLWLRDQLGVIDDFAKIEKLAQEVPDNDGVYFVPAFTGLGLPHWQPNARAAIVGLSSNNDRRHIVRAGLESIAYQLRDALESMMKSGRGSGSLHSLHGDGGATVNRLLMQFTADLNGVALRVATMADCSPLGAVMMGMLGAGVYNSLDELTALPQDEIVYQPTMPNNQAEGLYAGWQRAVRQTVAE